MMFLDDVRDLDDMEEEYQVRGTDFTVHVKLWQVFRRGVFCRFITEEVHAAFVGEEINASLARRICEKLRELDGKL